MKAIRQIKVKLASWKIKYKSDPKLLLKLESKKNNSIPIKAKLKKHLSQE